MDFIKTYFSAEKSESLIFMTIGVLAIAFSTYAIVKWGEPFYKGFAIPGILIGLIQIVVGGTVYFRSDKQTQELEMLYSKSKTDFVKIETDRMNHVMNNFSLYKKIEIAFVLTGLLMILLFSSKEFWLGIGVGMLLQDALMLTADVFAERRGMIYQTATSNQL
jgi:hypothetical protein